MKNRIDIATNTDNEEYDNILSQNIELSKENEKLNDEIEMLKNDLDKQKDMNSQLISRSTDKTRQIRQLQELYDSILKKYNELKENQHVFLFNINFCYIDTIKSDWTATAIIS